MSAAREPALGPAEAALAAWLDEVAVRAAAAGPAGPALLLVTPHGLPRRAALWTTLSAAGVRPVGRRALPGWPRLETAIRVGRRDGPALSRALAYEAAWAARFPGAAGEAWALPPGRGLARALAMKRWLRAAHPSLQVALGPQAAALHAFHLPEPEDAAREARLLAAALAVV